MKIADNKQQKQLIFDQEEIGGEQQGIDFFITLLQLFDSYVHVNFGFLKKLIFLFFFLAMLHGLWDLSSPTKD